MTYYIYKDSDNKKFYIERTEKDNSEQETDNTSLQHPVYAQYVLPLRIMSLKDRAKQLEMYEMREKLFPERYKREEGLL